MERMGPRYAFIVEYRPDMATRRKQFVFYYLAASSRQGEDPLAVTPVEIIR